MTLKQKALVEAITDKSNKETFGNGTKSVLKVYNTTDISTASSIASETLRKPEIQKAVHRILEDLGANIEHRIDLLWNIGQGKSNRTTKRYNIKDSKAQLVEVIKAEPTHQERIKAMDVLNRLGGDYEKVKIASQLAIDKYRALRKSILKDKKGKRAVS